MTTMAEERLEDTKGELRHSTSSHGTEDITIHNDVIDSQNATPSREGPAGPGPMSPEDPMVQAFENVVYSDIGVITLLSRLKQSIASARDFAAFLKKRSALEEEHAQGLKKLCRSTHESIRRPESRQGSYSVQFEEITSIHERMADNGIQFGLSLHQMHEDLVEMTMSVERGRKHWKQVGLNAEKRVQDSEALMEKAKVKYDSLAEEYDRARTGDRQASKKFGLKGPKSAAQHEEDIYRKVQNSDADYSTKVQTAQTQRHELLTVLRPQAVRGLQDLIRECDSALTSQLQRFATFNEKLLLTNGLSVSPLNNPSNGSAPQPRSLREVVFQIDNEVDMRNWVASFSSKVPQRPSAIQYQRHPTLATQQQSPAPMRPPQVQGLPPNPAAGKATVQSHDGDGPERGQSAGGQYSSQHISENSFGGAPPPLGHRVNHSTSSAMAMPPSQFPQPQRASTPPSRNGSPFAADLPPTKPVFGVSLEELFRRDGSAVPMVVYQCLQAIDLFGLDVEGIYRLSGTSSHIAKIKAMFNHDSTKVDFRNPEHFSHDVNSVAGVLKQFFRELPDPLLTTEHYSAFIEAARIDYDVARRDSLHAIINNLPDPNYATLRALTLHLHRVQEKASVNRMSASNLAICMGPTLMGAGSGSVADAGWQVRVIETILDNTYQIFDDD